MARTDARTPKPRTPRTTTKASAERAPTTSPWIERRDSAIHGRGVFARVDIPSGTRIIEYLGERITKAEAWRREEARKARQLAGEDGCVYIFELNKRHDIDGSMEWNTARLLNHSCGPNCRSETIRGHIWILARRDIAAGEELTFDYGYAFQLWADHPCRCGAKGCPGFIVNAAQRWRVRKLVKARARTERVLAREAARRERAKN